MIFKCKKIKDKIIPNTLYAVYYKDSKEPVHFVEKQDEDGSEAFIDIKYTLKEGQYGIFANEYHPSHVTDAKRADLLLLIVDEKQKAWASWVLDVKVTVGGKDVITHLIEQWQETYIHKKMFSIYLDGFTEAETIGVVTREYQGERIQTMVEALGRDIANITESVALMPKSPVVIDQQRRLLGMRLEYQMLEQFKNGYVTIENKTYAIKVYQLEGDESPYCGGIEVKLEQ